MPGQWSLSHCIHDGMSWLLEKMGSSPLKLWALRSLTVSSGMGKLERILSSPWVFPFLSHYYFLPQEHPWSWSLVRNGRGHSWAWALLSLVSLTSFPFFFLGLGMSASASETSWFLSLFYFFPIGCFLLKGLLFFWDVLLLQALWSWGSSSFLSLLDLAEHTSTSEGPFSFTAFALEEQVFSIPFVASSVFDFGFSFLLFLLLALAASPCSPQPCLLPTWMHWGVSWYFSVWATQVCQSLNCVQRRESDTAAFYLWSTLHLSIISSLGKRWCLLPLQFLLEFLLLWKHTMTKVLYYCLVMYNIFLWLAQWLWVSVQIIMVGS